MALETRIPKEITDYREKIVLGLSARQLVSVACAVVVVGLSAFVLWYLLGLNFSVVEYILIIEALPFAAFGFIRHKGMPFEQVARIRLRHRFGEKRLLNKTSLDHIPSLYPLSQTSGSQPKGVRREISVRKERFCRRRQSECLESQKTRKRRPFPPAKRARTKKRSTEAKA